MGAIDIVTGRAAPTAIANERGYQEVDKNKYVDGSPNTEEGNIDFENDSARVFLTMSTGGDDKYGSSIDAIGDTAAPTGEGSAAVVKADNTRIVAKAGGNVTVVANGANIHSASSGNVQIVTAGTISMGTSEPGGTEDSPGLQAFVRGEDLLAAVTALKNDLALPATTLPTPAGPAPTAPLTVDGSPFANFVDAVEAALSSVIKGE